MEIESHGCGLTTGVEMECCGLESMWLAIRKWRECRGDGESWIMSTIGGEMKSCEPRPMEMEKTM